MHSDTSEPGIWEREQGDSSEEARHAGWVGPWIEEERTVAALMQHRKEGGKAGKCLKSLWAELQGRMSMEKQSAGDKALYRNRKTRDKMLARSESEAWMRIAKAGVRGREIGGSCYCARMTRRRACMCVGIFGACAGILFQTRGPWCTEYWLLEPSAKIFFVIAASADQFRLQWPAAEARERQARRGAGQEFDRLGPILECLTEQHLHFYMGRGTGMTRRSADVD